jgi:hypothetical protein
MKQFLKRTAEFLFHANRKAMMTVVILIVLVVAGAYTFWNGWSNKLSFGIKSLAVLNKISNLLPIQPDEKKELEAVNSLAEAFTKKDDREWKFLVFLQNNMELRPGGGFLGQYAIVKVKNGEATSVFVEDANLLDQRISAKISPPYPFKRMVQLKNWKFRDSNFSPDFPTNIEKAKYFYRLAGNSGNFDGYIAVNSEVFNHILALTGPISVPEYPGEYTSDNGALKLEEFVEKQYIMNPELDTQNRKMVMKKMAPIIIEKLVTLNNIPKVAELIHKEFKNKNIMVNFVDPELQKIADGVQWTGKMASDWDGDYLMIVDANMGSLKTNYYIKHEINYELDFTQPKPTATLNVQFKNTAPFGDWRTSDYHSYTRIYLPKGANFLDRKMVGYPNIGEEFGKTYFGVVVHSVMGGKTDGMVKYELPSNINENNYKLLIQKQSGIDSMPIKIKIKTKNKEYVSDQLLNGDLKFEIKQQ